jgi:hypothetical protein
LLAVTDVPRQCLEFLVKAYRLLLKPHLGNACRFEPTCSQYALDALRQHGAFVGGSLTAGRLLRCQPWCQGGCDPVPRQAPALFSRLGLVGRRPDALIASMPEHTTQPNPKTLSHD